MINLTLQQQNIIKVLERMIELVRNDENYADDFEEPLEDMLEEMASYDAFGTEGQLDPRGDMREGPWSMWDVEGVEE